MIPRQDKDFAAERVPPVIRQHEGGLEGRQLHSSSDRSARKTRDVRLQGLKKCHTVPDASSCVLKTSAKGPSPRNATNTIGILPCIGEEEDLGLTGIQRWGSDERAPIDSSPQHGVCRKKNETPKPPKRQKSFK